MPVKKQNNTLCPLCNAEHFLENCSQFIKSTVQERKDILRKKGHCYGCINKRHRIQTCVQRQTCNTCQGLHPTLLHYERQTTSAPDDGGNKRADERVSAHVATCVNALNQDESELCQAKNKNCINSMIVPVILRHKDDTSQSTGIQVYAVLDNQSNGCFITNSVMEELKITGRTVDLRLSTMSGEDSVQSKAIRGLVVEGVNSQDSTCIDLPTTYSREIIPIDRDLIPCPVKAQKWSHLSTIADHLRPPDDSLPIGLLIGMNCPRAIKPREVQLGAEDDPWAVRTLLGWGICGIVDKSTGDSASHFVHRTSVTEISPAQLVTMYNIDFHERQTDEKISAQDRLFLKIMEEGIERREDGHFELPLPFKSDTILYCQTTEDKSSGDCNH